MLNQEQVDAYHRDGYITVNDIIPQEQIAALRQVSDEFLEKSRKTTEHTDLFDLEPEHSAEEPRLRRLKSPERHHPTFDKTFRDDNVLDILEQLIGPGIRHFGSKLNMKSAGFGSAVEWHQDYAFSPRTNDDILVVGVPLDDMDEDNGCLLVVPGSHRGPIYSHHQDDVFVGAVSDPDFDPSLVVPIELKAGDISIHHCRTLHASRPNINPERSRRLYLEQYAAADSWRLRELPIQDFAIFNSSMLRGEPPTKPRWTDVPEVPMPEVVRPGLGGSIYESQTQLKQRLMAEGKEK